MKNLLLTCSLLLLTSVIFAQTVTVSIVGLNDKDSKAEVVFQVKSAELINILDSRTNQVVGQKILIEKGNDEVSDVLKKAASSGEISSAATINYKNGGKSIKVNLSSVIVTNYSWKIEEGESIEETFELTFRTIN